MSLRKLPPVAPKGDEYRLISNALSNAIDNIQPFGVSPVQSATFTVSYEYGMWPCDASATAMTANLPSAVAYDGKTFVVKKVDAGANVVLVDGLASETIDGSITTSLTSQYQSVRITSDGAKWLKS